MPSSKSCSLLARVFRGDDADAAKGAFGAGILQGTDAASPRRWPHANTKIVDHTRCQVCFDTCWILCRRRLLAGHVDVLLAKQPPRADRLHVADQPRKGEGILSGQAKRSHRALNAGARRRQESRGKLPFALTPSWDVARVLRRLEDFAGDTRAVSRLSALLLGELVIRLVQRSHRPSSYRSACLSSHCSIRRACDVRWLALLRPRLRPLNSPRCCLATTCA
jgi:hypothetical protein